MKKQLTILLLFFSGLMAAQTMTYESAHADMLDQITGEFKEQVELKTTISIINESDIEITFNDETPLKYVVIDCLVDKGFTIRQLWNPIETIYLIIDDQKKQLYIIQNNKILGYE